MNRFPPHTIRRKTTEPKGNPTDYPPGSVHFDPHIEIIMSSVATTHEQGAGAALLGVLAAAGLWYVTFFSTLSAVEVRPRVMLTRNARFKSRFRRAARRERAWLGPAALVAAAAGGAAAGDGAGGAAELQTEAAVAHGTVVQVGT